MCNIYRIQWWSVSCGRHENKVSGSAQGGDVAIRGKLPFKVTNALRPSASECLAPGEAPTSTSGRLQAHKVSGSHLRKGVAVKYFIIKQCEISFFERVFQLLCPTATPSPKIDCESCPILASSRRWSKRLIFGLCRRWRSKEAWVAMRCSTGVQPKITSTSSLPIRRTTVQRISAFAGAAGKQHPASAQLARHDAQGVGQPFWGVVAALGRIESSQGAYRRWCSPR